LANPRDLDLDKVDAQETRRILDRLYGYEVSPVLWRKVMPKLSAGRVQSVATRLVVDRERERIAFRSADYAGLDARLDAGERADPRRFPARLTHIGSARVAQGRDFDARGNVKQPRAGESGADGDQLVHLGEASAQQLAARMQTAEFSVRTVESKPYRRSPYAPFRTTTLQQEAGRKLGYTSQRTMSVAQDLYEAGFITYMRTDSTTLSDAATAAARDQARELFGDRYLPSSPRTYVTKVKGAQEAHEAVRPAGDTFRTPAQTGLTGDQFRLYDLIWKRTVASQMRDAQGSTVTVRINAHSDLDSGNDSSPATNGGHPDVHTQDCTFVASGRTISFHGFLKAYVESKDDSSAATDDQQTRLPDLAEGQRLAADEVTAAGHQTKPPARYTEPSLVAKLEELNIGRPSTYATIIRTITSRDYVFKRGSALVPTWLAFAVTRLLETHFPRLVDYEFTADMEEDLDKIAEGDARRVQVLSEFYYGSGGQAGLHKLVTELGDIDARAVSTFPIGELDDTAGDGQIVARVGRYGTYVEDADGRRASVPDELPPDELTVDRARELLAQPMGAEYPLGDDPDTGNPVVAKNGRFGPYVTEVLPDDAPKNTKPRTASLFKQMTLEDVTLEQALRLLNLPRVIGISDDEQITAQNGRYGPYLKKGSDSRSLGSEDEIFSTTLEQAQALFAQPKQRGRAAARPPLKELGEDPASGKPMVVKEGRFGRYVTDGEYNATLRRDDTVEAMTSDRAAELLAEKRAKGPAPKKSTTKKSTAKKSTPKKSTPKQSTTKQSAGKKSTGKKSTAKKSATGAAKSNKSPANNATAKNTTTGTTGPDAGEPNGHDNGAADSGAERDPAASGTGRE
jgi:DNA topoisomerase-1